MVTPTSHISEAGSGVVREWLHLVAADQGQPLSEIEQYNYTAFILHNYISDTPGYVGPVGFIVWGGDPRCITQFLKVGEKDKRVWIISYNGNLGEPA